MEAKTEKKGNIIDAFVGGARNGFKIGTNSMVPNIIFGFAVISILNLTGLMEIIGKVFTPIIGIVDYCNSIVSKTRILELCKISKNLVSY